MAIAFSNPARVDGAVGSSAVTTASFTPAADAVLVALVVANSAAASATTATITDSNGTLVWTQQSVANYATTGKEGYAGVFTATVPAGAPALTVTATTAGSTATTRRPSLQVFVLTGTDEHNLVAGVGWISSTANSATFTFNQLVPGSFLLVAGCDWAKLGVPTSSNLNGTGFDQATAPGVSGLFGWRQLPNTIGSQTYNLDAFGTAAAAWNAVRVEIRPNVPLVGVPFLPELGSGAKIGVEVAWGADITASSETWAWTDITTDVRTDPPIALTMGRSDEAGTTQPATCTLMLNNASGNYSLGGQAANWPNVRRNTPVRVRIDTDGTGATTVFAGFAAGFTPTWDMTGTVPTVKLEVAGTLRRLQQGSAPVLSPIRRALVKASSTIAYWPCEDGKNAAYLAPAVGNSPMQITGPVEPGAASAWPSTPSMVHLKTGSRLSAPVPAYANTNQQQVRFLSTFPNSVQPDLTPILRVWTTGTVARWDMRYVAPGNLDLKGYNSYGALVLDVFSVSYGIDDHSVRLSLELVQNGANIDWRFGTLFLNNAAGYTAATLANQTAGIITRVEIDPLGLLNDVTVGHVSVQNAQTNMFDVSAEMLAYPGENAITRLRRLCTENAVPLTVQGTSDVAMGHQPAGSLVTLLRECERADQGILFDGRSAGLTYIARSLRENAAPDLTVAAAQLSAPLLPVDDDQRTRNKVTASRTGGTSAIVEDVTGPMGTAVIGLYDDSLSVNIADDTRVADYAGWTVHLGTNEGYRYPSVALDMRATAILAASVLAVEPSSRVDVTNPATAAKGHPTGTVALLVEGVSMQLSPFMWTAILKASSYDPWRIGRAGDVVGATPPVPAEFVMRLDTDGATLAAAVVAGATTLSVARTNATSPLWTTDANDLPFVITLGGTPVTVTAISGAASPQTFTVTAGHVTRAFAIGTPVSLYDPPVLGL